MQIWSEFHASCTSEKVLKYVVYSFVLALAAGIQRAIRLLLKVPSVPCPVLHSAVQIFQLIDMHWWNIEIKSVGTSEKFSTWPSTCLRCHLLCKENLTKQINNGLYAERPWSLHKVNVAYRRGKHKLTIYWKVYKYQQWNLLASPDPINKQYVFSSSDIDVKQGYYLHWNITQRIQWPVHFRMQSVVSYCTPTEKNSFFCGLNYRFKVNFFRNIPV